MRTTSSKSRRLAAHDRTILPIVAIGALAVALVVVGLLHLGPAGRAPWIGDLLPGWPWWYP